MISSIFPFPLSPFLFFLPRSSLFAILSKPPSFLFLLPLFFLLFSINSLFPPSFPSQPYLLSLSSLSLSLPRVTSCPPFFFLLPSHSSSSFVSPSNTPPFLPPSHSLFSPSSLPPLSLDSYLPPHCLFVPLIPPNDLPTIFLSICHLVNPFNSFECKCLERSNK